VNFGKVSNAATSSTKIANTRNILLAIEDKDNHSFHAAQQHMELIQNRKMCVMAFIFQHT